MPTIAEKLFLAVPRNEYDQTRTLLAELFSQGTLPLFIDIDGMTLLHHATSTEMVELLVRYGVDVNTPDYDLWTTLHLAAQESPELIPSLIELGADASAQTDCGLPPLSLLVEFHPEKIDIARYLLENGASATLADNNLWTPLHYAAGEATIEEHEMVLLLLDYGADLDTPNEQGHTPADYITDPDLLRIVERYIPLAESSTGDHIITHVSMDTNDDTSMERIEDPSRSLTSALLTGCESIIDAT